MHEQTTAIHELATKTATSSATRQVPDSLRTAPCLTEAFSQAQLEREYQETVRLRFCSVLVLRWRSRRQLGRDFEVKIVFRFQLQICFAPRCASRRDIHSAALVFSNAASPRQIPFQEATCTCSYMELDTLACNSPSP